MIFRESQFSRRLLDLRISTSHDCDTEVSLTTRLRKDMISPMIRFRLCFSFSCSHHDEPLYEPLNGFGVFDDTLAFPVQC